MIARVNRSPTFLKQTKHLDGFLRKRLKRLIEKIMANTAVGKPLKYRRGERALYVKPFRLVYAVRGDEIILLKFEHRKSVYRT